MCMQTVTAGREAGWIYWDILNYFLNVWVWQINALCPKHLFPSFQARVYWRGNLIRMFLIHLHLTHQNPTWWELLDVHEPSEPCVINHLELSFLCQKPQWGTIFSGFSWGSKTGFRSCPQISPQPKNSNCGQTHCHTLYLVLANNLKSRDRHFVKINKYGLRSNSNYVRSTLWVSGTGSKCPRQWLASPSFESLSGFVSLCFRLNVQDILLICKE